MDELQLTQSDTYETLQPGYCVPLTDWALVKLFNERVTSRRVKGRVSTRFIVIQHAEK